MPQLGHRLGSDFSRNDELTMSPLLAIALTTGLLSTLWGWLASTLGLITWIGFLGCTSFFASQGGYQGLGQTLICNLTGVAWGMLLINGEPWWGASIGGYLITGIAATLMCLQAKQPWLSYIPATFIGCCATFGAAGAWQAVIPALIVGALFGYAMKSSGLWLSQKTQATPADKNPRA